jgi:uncharacterized protein (DUF1684 family)
MKTKRRFVLTAIVLLGLSTLGSSADAVDPAYQKSFDQWKAELVDDLKQNWLPLAGLFWLKPGGNTFGSDASNAVVFPKGPAHAGSFILQNNDVTANFADGTNAVVDSKTVKTAKLASDTSGHRTLVELGSLRFHVIQRGQRVGIRLKDVDSPMVHSYAGPVFFPLDSNYIVTAKWVPSDGKKTVDVPNVLGDVTATPVAGEVRFKLNGQEMQLTDLGGDAAKGLFFVFNDLTAKTETYQGGRFLQTDAVKDGTVVLDFNRAYNPPCAVTPYATCPLAPKENRLTVAIPAGEKYDHKLGHH